MGPSSSPGSLCSVFFEDKIKFSASRHLALARSQWFTAPETKSEMWSMKPPDFSIKLYKSLTVPQRKERMKTVAVPPPRSDVKRRTGTFWPLLLYQSQQREVAPKFITSYRPPGALESELMFVKTGKFSSGAYKNPKPHNFRPLDEDLPAFITTCQRDPGHLDFRLKPLDVIRTIRSESDFKSRDTMTRMDTYRTPEPTWDAKLLLPQLPWPPKSSSYTTHRRRRGAYSAFLERVEENLSRSWENRSSS